MFARRLLIVGLVVLVVVVLRSAVSMHSEPPLGPDGVGLDVDRDDDSLSPTASPSGSTTNASATSASAVSSPARTTSVGSEPVGSLLTVELADLVVASRSPLSAVEVVDDGEVHPHHDASDTGVGATAASVVVSGWTWRFDDPVGRVRDQLAGLADDDVIEALAPTPQEAGARAVAGEVSWVIVRTVTVAGSEATVIFDHHMVTSRSAEMVTTRTAVVTVVDGRAIEVRL